LVTACKTNPSDEAGGPIDTETPGDSWLDHRVKYSNFDSWLVVTGTMEFYDFPYIGNNDPNPN